MITIIKVQNQYLIIILCNLLSSNVEAVRYKHHVKLDNYLMNIKFLFINLLNFQNSLLQNSFIIIELEKDLKKKQW